MKPRLGLHKNYLLLQAVITFKCRKQQTDKTIQAFVTCCRTHPWENQKYLVFTQQVLAIYPYIHTYRETPFGLLEWALRIKLKTMLH